MISCTGIEWNSSSNWTVITVYSCGLVGLAEGEAFTSFPSCSFFNNWSLIAETALDVCGILNLWMPVTTTSSPAALPSLKVITSGCFFFIVIFTMEFSECLAFTLAQPVLSEHSRSTTRWFSSKTRWLEGVRGGGEGGGGWEEGGGGGRRERRWWEEMKWVDGESEKRNEERKEGGRGTRAAGR